MLKLPVIYAVAIEAQIFVVFYVHSKETIKAVQMECENLLYVHSLCAHFFDIIQMCTQKIGVLFDINAHSNSYLEFNTYRYKRKDIELNKIA